MPKGIYKRKPKNKNIKHGIVTFLRSSKIHPSIRGFKKLQEHLLTMENSLILEQCEPGELTAREEILIKGIVEAYGVSLLGSMFVKKYGVLSPGAEKKGEMEFQPILSKSMIAFQNTIRQNILALEHIRRENGSKKPKVNEAEFIKEIEQNEISDDGKAETSARS